MINDLREKMERWKMKANVFLKNDTKVFIVDIDDHYYWADLILVEEDTVTVECFSGKLAGNKETLLWADVVKFEEYREAGR